MLVVLVLVVFGVGGVVRSKSKSAHLAHCVDLFIDRSAIRIYASCALQQIKLDETNA